MKKYLGDGVYFNFDGYHVVLTTENGISTTNTIYLEPEVIEAFLKALPLLCNIPKPEQIKELLKLLAK